MSVGSQFDEHTGGTSGIGWPFAVICRAQRPRGVPQSTSSVQTEVGTLSYDLVVGRFTRCVERARPSSR